MRYACVKMCAVSTVSPDLPYNIGMARYYGPLLQPSKIDACFVHM